jgi:hypothetical protein
MWLLHTQAFFQAGLAVSIHAEIYPEGKPSFGMTWKSAMP